MENEGVCKRFRPEEIKVPFLDNGVPKDVPCILFQIGCGKVRFHDPATTFHNVDGPQVAVLTVLRPFFEGEACTQAGMDKITANFAEEVIAVVGPGMALHKPRYKETTTQFFRGVPTKVAVGSVRVKPEAVGRTVQKSGLNGFFFRPVGKDGSEVTAVPLRDCKTLLEAFKLAKTLGPLNLGLQFTVRSFVARVRGSDRPEAFAKLCPEYAQCIGEELLTLPKGKGIHLTIHGVPIGMPDEVLVRSITLHEDDGTPWRYQPLGRKPTAKGCADVSARALTAPPQTSAILTSGHYRQRICLSVAPAKKSVWDDVVPADANASADYPETIPRPAKAAIRTTNNLPSFSQVAANGTRHEEPATTRNWFDQLEEEVDEQELADEFFDDGMSADAWAAKQDVENYLECMEDDANDASAAFALFDPPAPKLIPKAKVKPTLATSSGNTDAPQQQQQQQSKPDWMTRLEEFNKAISGDRARSEETRVNADRRFCEVQASINQQGEQFTKALNDIRLRHNEAAEEQTRRMERIESLHEDMSKRQHLQFTQMQQSQEALQRDISHRFEDLFARLTILSTALPQQQQHQQTSPTIGQTIPPQAHLPHPTPYVDATTQQQHAAAGAAAAAVSVAPPEVPRLSIPSKKEVPYLVTGAVPTGGEVPGHIQNLADAVAESDAAASTVTAAAAAERPDDATSCEADTPRARPSRSLRKTYTNSPRSPRRSKDRDAAASEAAAAEAADARSTSRKGPSSNAPTS